MKATLISRFCCWTLSLSILLICFQSVDGFTHKFNPCAFLSDVQHGCRKISTFQLLAARSTGDETLLGSRRKFLSSFPSSVFFSAYVIGQFPLDHASAANYPPIDVNNAMAREFTAFPGLYPTVATKIVNAAKKTPFKTKADVYAALDTDMERDRLRIYDSSIKVMKVDKSLQQFKGSQICKFECGSRVSNIYRDEQIRAVQDARK